MSQNSVNGTFLQMFHWYSEGDGSHWKSVAERASDLARSGFTAAWLPPAYKGFGGAVDVGYGVYDMYDLGEFDQKGSVRTKYGTHKEYLAAVKALQKAAVQVYADTVFNHRMGADESEDVNATAFRQDDRIRPIGGTQPIRAWTRYTFTGRKGKHSKFTWDHRHFDAVDWDDKSKQGGMVYLLEGKSFDDQVALENGNFAYLMGSDLDCQSPEVQAELEAWGKWYLDTTGVDGFRLDAIKHIAAWFFPQWIDAMEKHAGKHLFVVGEYWQQDLNALLRYLAPMQDRMSVFDVPLHYNLHQASRAGSWFDMRKIFDNTLVQARPTQAVTFVDNHDSQPLQALESWVEAWFKPIAYGLILLREGGYPCVFEADWTGATYTDKGRDGNQHTVELPSHRYLLERFLWARQNVNYGLQLDWFDHWNRVGWVRLGDELHPHAMAVLVSDGQAGSKWMDVRRPNTQFLDITGHDKESMWTNNDGWGEFRCPGGSISVWVEAAGVPEEYR